MPTTTVLQSPTQPSRIAWALEDLADKGTAEIRWAVAYVTEGGCKELVPRIKGKTSPSTWTSMSKTLITCFDFHMTDPAALRWLRDSHGFTLRVTHQPASFHPKVYEFEGPLDGGALIGSPNLTRNAMTSNTEAAAVLRYGHRRPSDLRDQWTELMRNSQPLTDLELTVYEGNRKGSPPPLPPDDPPASPPPLPAKSLGLLAEAVANGFNPAASRAFWIQTKTLQGGGKNQLELPRGANGFFGFHYTTYTQKHHVIGTLNILGSGKTTPKKLTWHGNNRMERLNLPTKTQGGQSYTNAAVLFRRRSRGSFEIYVTPWSSPTAEAWKIASQKTNAVFRLGKSSPRICGFF